jgi:triosephosphate isomerase
MDIIMGNWKMNANHLEAIQMIQKLHYRLREETHRRVTVVVAPPFTSLRSVQTVIEADRMPIKLAAQNVHAAAKGAHTGEISAPMLDKLKVSYVIVGHSERRADGESNQDVNAKAKAVLNEGMIPVVCIGEVLQEREDGRHNEVVTTMLTESLKGISTEELANVVVAYEPVWAIGTGKSATVDDAGDMCATIRKSLRTHWGEAGDGVSILYGGSVNAGNIAAYMAKREIGGALVGGASLDPDKFASVIQYWI